MLRTHALFSDHMVLQRGRENRIWGWDTPGQVVTLSIEGADVPPSHTITAHDGRWQLDCPELPPGGAYRLLLHGSSEKVMSDVLCGEVWLAAGQSNMEWPLSEAVDAEATIAAANHPHIRLFHIQNATSHTPLDDVTARWQPSTPSTAGTFSAVAYHFGRELHATQHMPIGLVEAAWGGTRIEAWTSVEALRALFDVDAELAGYPDENEMQHQPAALFNALIAPLAGFGMRGVIWYQGESNAEQHASYHQRFVAMIRDWRAQWDEPFPFLFVQLASFLGGPTWPWLREAQAAALTEPDTGMAVAIDIGDPNDVHPRNKREVGRRLSLVARAIVYGEPVQYAGPVLRSHEQTAGLLTLRFAHANGMTTSNGGVLKGLEVANADGVFAPTTAHILDNALVIDAPDATAVRYAWHDYVECNLINGVGLPAAPFRIDIRSQQPAKAAKPMQSTAIVFTAPNEVSLGSFELPEPRPGELLVQTRYTCVSPGTELRVLSGKQTDLPAWPLIPGYALVGEVIRCDPATQIAEGTLVFCTGTGRSDLARSWGGHVAHAVISEERAFPIPASVDPIEAAMAKLAAITYHGARLSHPRPDEIVAVIGLGPIGQLAARIHAAMGARVVAADVSPRRVAQAQAAGIEAYTVHGTLHETLGAAIPRGADVLVDATGAPGVIAQAVELARDMNWGDDAATGARYLVQGSYADSFSIAYQPAFSKELSFLLPRDQLPRDLRAVLDLFARGRLQAHDLISDIRPPVRAAESYAELRDPQGMLTTVVFDWQ